MRLLSKLFGTKEEVREEKVKKCYRVVDENTTKEMNKRRRNIRIAEEVLEEMGANVTVLSSPWDDIAIMMAEFNLGKGVISIVKNGIEQKINVIDISMDFNEDYFEIGFIVKETGERHSKRYNNNEFSSFKKVTDNGRVVYSMCAGDMDKDCVYVEAIY